MNLAVDDFILYFSNQQNVVKEINFFFEYEGLKGNNGFQTDVVFFLDGEEVVELHPKITKEKNMRIFIIDVLNQLEIQNRMDVFLKLFLSYKDVLKKIQIKKERYERLPHDFQKKKVGENLLYEIESVLEKNKKLIEEKIMKRVNTHTCEKAYFLISMNQKELIELPEQLTEKQIRIV